MNTDDTIKNDIEIEMESLRKELAHLHSLILCPTYEIASPKVVPASQLQPMHHSFELLDDGPLGMALVNPECRIIKANRMLCRMLGHSENEICTLRFQDIAPNTNKFSQLIRQIFDKVYPVGKTEGEFLRKERETVWIRMTVSYIAENYNGQRCCLILVEDINDRKSAEQTLQTEKQLLEWLINSSVDGIVAFDGDGFFTVWNPGMERIFGIKDADTLGRPAMLACPFFKDLGEDLNIAAALKGKKVISRDKCYIIPGSSRLTYFEGYYGPIYNPSDGKVIGGLAIIRDVTDRKLAEEDKRVSEERYRELFENAYDMVYTHDFIGKITSINKAAERILGYSKAEALQMKFSQLVAPDYRQTARKMIERQRSEETPMTCELELVAKDGTYVSMEVIHRLIFREGTPYGIQGTARDIRERKKSEAALQTANKKLEAWVQELEQRTRDMTLLNEMGDILRACLTHEEIYEVIMRISQEVFPIRGGALFVMGPQHSIVESVAEWGDVSEIKSTFTPDECWSLRRGRVHWVEDTQTGLLCKHLQSPAPKGYICVPMMAQSEAVGILHLTYSDESQMSEAKQRLAIAMAERIAMALSNLRLHETLRNQSIRDPLTGLFNRSFLEESLELEMRRASRSHNSLSIIMLMLDDFQSINEDYGLDTGDFTLHRAGTLLQSNIRKGDIVCRFSGHTFVVVLPQCTQEVGRERAEILRKLLKTLEIKNSAGRTVQISASFGLSLYPNHGQTVEALLDAAEAAVSRARNNGGDCIVTTTR
jgi:diguanylate cyclase (GGDEF)-like protein/PAS domain S-box-containing protein